MPRDAEPPERDAPDGETPDHERVDVHPARFATDARDCEPADFEPVFQGCSWIRWCFSDRHRLSDAQWDAALSIAGRCAVAGHQSPRADGRQLAHWMGRGHRGYSVAETDARLDHALDDAGPRSCEAIAHSLGAWNVHCRLCPRYGEVESPIDLGRPAPAEEEPTADAPAAAERAGNPAPEGGGSI